MKRGVIRTAVFLCVCLCAASAWSQAADGSRKAQYETLYKQYMENKDWAENHPMSGFWARNKRDKQAQAARERLFTQFRDITLARLTRLQEEIKRLSAVCANAPYVSFNTLPEENLKKMASDKELLRLLLLQYPDNAAYLPVQTLLELLENDEPLEEYLINFVLYLRNYERYPACIAGLDSAKRHEAERLCNDGSRARLVNMLARDCASYARERDLARFERISQENFKRCLRAPRSLLHPHEDSVYYAQEY